MTEAPARLPPSRPQYTLNSDKYSTSIKIDKWAITSTKKPILNGPEIEAYVPVQLVPLFSVVERQGFEDVQDNTNGQCGEETESAITRNDFRQQLPLVYI